jgi:leader peptidase (prepilin peptidase)/N-methyltransferase
VELLTGVAFAAAAWVYGPTLPAVKLALFAALQIGLVFADLETRLLPDQFTVGGAVIGFALAFFAPPQPILPGFVWGPLGGVLEALIGAAVAAGGLWLIGEVYARVRHREGLGFGDVKMVAMIAAFLGLGPTLATLLMASLVGSIGGVIWIYVLKKGTATYEIPFASFLGGAALVAGFIYR